MDTTKHKSFVFSRSDFSGIKLLGLLGIFFGFMTISGMKPAYKIILFIVYVVGIALIDYLVYTVSPLLCGILIGLQIVGLITKTAD